MAISKALIERAATIPWAERRAELDWLIARGHWSRERRPGERYADPYQAVLKAQKKAA